MKCNKCDYEWEERTKKPKTCPRCKSPYWNDGFYFNCEICKRHFLIINVHHIDGNHENNKKKNKLFLCNDCHKAIHNGIGTTNKKKMRNYGVWRQGKAEIEIIEKIEFYRKKWLT